MCSLLALSLHAVAPLSAVGRFEEDLTGRQCVQNVVMILQDIHALLKCPPNPDPRTWVNKKAADLYFCGGEEGREEYKRTVRRFAQRSMEEDGGCFCCVSKYECTIQCESILI